MIGNSVITTALTPPATTAGFPLDHLSWSGIKTYATCPKKFYFKYIAQAQTEFVPATLAFGSAFHRAVEAVHHARIQGAEIPAVDTLMVAYDAAWKEETIRAPEVQFAKTEDTLSLREMAIRMLAAYREHAVQNATSGTQVIAIEYGHRYKLLADVPEIELRLDLLELNGTDLVITDFKTSRSRWNDDNVREHLGQLVLYANGLVPLMKDIGATRIVPRFVIVSKAKKPAVQILVPKATQEDVMRLKSTIADTWTAIKSGVFVQRESFWCAQCPFKKRCLG